MFMLSRQHRIFLILYAMLLCTSCTQDYIESGVIPDRVPGKVAVSFEIEIPVAVPVQSYAAAIAMCSLWMCWFSTRTIHSSSGSEAT